MEKREFGWVAAALSVLLTLALPVSAAAANYVILFEDGVKSDVAKAAVEQAGGTLTRDLTAEVGFGLASSDDADFAAALSRNPAVSGVAVDVMFGPAMTNKAGYTPTIVKLPPDVLEARLAEKAGEKDVTDPTQAAFYDFLQWNLRVMHADDAWALGNLGDPEVLVVVVDSGIDYTHLDLEGIVDLDRSISLVPEDDAYLAEHFPGTHPIADLNFHGTIHAGQIACNAIGTACVSPNVSLVGVKVADQFYNTSYGRMAAGILYATSIGADIINVSYQFYDTTIPFPNGYPKIDRPATQLGFDLLKLAVNYAKIHGALVITEAGGNPIGPFGPGINADENGNSIILPAEVGTLVISSSSIDDDFSNFGNYGATLVSMAGPGGEYPFPDPFTQEVFGPCSRFTTASFFQACTIEPPNWAAIAGPPIAAAQVAGVAALIDSQAGGALAGKQIERQLLRTADDLGEPGFDEFFGHGRVNALRAVTE